MTDPDLCKWLREHSSGIYRPSAEAARRIESLNSELNNLRTSQAKVGCLTPKKEDNPPENNCDVIENAVSHALFDIKIPRFEADGYRNGYLDCISKIQEAIDLPGAKT